MCESVHIARRLHLLPAISVERYGHGRGQTAADYGQLWLERLSTIGLYNKEGGSMVIFKASALWADAFYKSICPCVCVSVCPSVHFLRYRLTVFLPPLPEVGCSIFLEIRNPWGKVMERSGVTFKHFCLEVV